MREILFRGKRVDNGKWVEGLPWKKKYNSNELFISSFPDKDDNEETFVVLPETVGQFTGLNDKNGKKIFEGDIVRENTWPHDIGVVSFETGTFDSGHYRYHGWIYKGTNAEINNRELYVYEDEDVDNSFEVIVNIHDRPELTEGGKYGIQADNA